MENNSGWILVDETHYLDTKTGETFEIIRDSLKLDRINENGTISEMIKTIDQNFQNLAAHGGGPDGVPGMDGINGADGTSAEYIFALCDEELEEGTHYPTTDDAKNDLFDSVEFAGSTSFNKKIKWFDHPQGVSKEHKNEYVFSRVVRVQGETKEWKPAEKPELWAHWGETGKDGDGVEYIFMRSKTKLDESTLEDIIIKKKSMSGDKYQSVIYQMDGFFPGEEWFKDDKNKTNAWKAINAKYGEVPSDFETLWSNRFNMIVPGYDWTDEPKGTDPINVYEYVAIRRCNVDDEDGKEWGDFSMPAIWSHYGLSTRTIIIYCNTEDTTSPVSPQTGQGIWNESEGKLTLPDSLVKAGWKDTNETPSENQITWMCSGIFDNSGKNVSWSKPMRITGKDGKQGEDGTTVEFIYALSKDMPAHPTIEKETTDSKPGVINTKEELFDAAKNANTEYNGQVWYDRAQPISPDKPTEYVWSRRRDKESEPWEYEDEPIIWAHWGEDGTDGDGVEYIFAVTLNNPPTTSLILPVYKNLNDDQKKIFQIDDFYPDNSWFTKTQVKNGITTYPNKEKAQKVLGDRFDEGKWSRYYDFNVSSGWSDNPVEVSPSTPYQWVSIRRSYTDKTTGGKRFWEDFSTPVLWNSYGKRTRSFIVYCNMPDETTPKSPAGGWWNTSNNTLQMNKDNSDEYKSNALLSGTPDYKSNVGYWSDKNIDVSKTITWISTGEFSDSIDKEGSNNISWSAPFRITGANGKAGADGSNIQFIYARQDTEPSYPSLDDKTKLNDFFNTINTNRHSYWPENGDKKTYWTDNPQGIEDTKGKRKEWVWSRSLPAGLDDVPANWIYMPAPVIWSRWGEDGTDGDGVEYIFYHGTSIDGHSPNVNNMTDYQKAIYQISDFYPGEGWFTDGKNNTPDNKTEARNAIISAGLEIPSNFDSLWNSKFGFNLGWTDNPSGVNFDYPFEWVSIRKTKNDPEDTSGKIWGPFSDPKPWANYNTKTRLFMVYCNVGEGTTPGKPLENDFTWDVQNDKLVKSQDSTTIWSDTDIDVPGQIAWLCSGLFSENGSVISWSEPFRITGAEGKKGADGSTIEFVYCLSEEMPAFPNNPSDSNDYTNKCNFFEDVENQGTNGYVYTDPSTDKQSKWFDNPQGIEDTEGKRKEWVWSRSLPANATSGTQWTFPPKPVIWAHWGEDGTDGDGVEYIFLSSINKTISSSEFPLKGSALTDEVQKVIYNIDDFYPSPRWFTPTTKKLAEDTLKEAKLYNADTFEEQWGNMFGFTFVGGETGPYWTDNPTGVSATKPNEFVSIRKSDYKTGKKIWNDFSDPALWSSYGKSTRTIMVYCNMVGDKTPATPTGGWWSATDKKLYNSENNKTSYKYNVLSDEERNKIPSDIYSETDKENIGYWQDDDNDVHDTITWVATGTFDEDGTNLDWSSPHRITGAKGEKGADGSDIQFIYALSDDNPAYPTNDNDRNNLFEAVENPSNAGTYISGIDVYQKEIDIPSSGRPDLYAVVDKKYVHYHGTDWYDRAQVISTEHRTEYCASRTLAKGSTTWIPDDKPFVWAHWGEDGTDGDGVEYIFTLKPNKYDWGEETWKGFWSFLNSTDTSDNILIKKVVYSMDDFYPGADWFNNTNNEKKVRETLKTKYGKEYTDDAWNNQVWSTVKGSFDRGFTDNPQDLTSSNKYQYVSIRKTVDGEWGAFSYPKLWAKYNLTQFKAFAFTSTPVSVELGNLKFEKGIKNNDINNPLPIPKDKTYTWTDGPNPTEQNPQVWMTSATIREDNLGNTTWAKPQRMTDNAEFQVEWSSDDITGNELSSKISKLADNKYNFGNYFKDGITEADAETNWRKAVKDDKTLGLTFEDSSDNAILMATCHKSNGKWSNWELVRVKGEKGDAGTSINMKTPITYEVYLDDNNYTINAAKAKFDAEQSKLTPTPTKGNLAIVYPKTPGDNGIYNGDPTLGNALYMCKYNGSSWDEYWSSEDQVSETTGDTHPSPNGHLILWDGDSWMDVGNIVGPAGPVSVILVKYAKDSNSSDPNIKYEFVPDTEIYTAKYVGFITYPEGSTPNAIMDPNDSDWHWQLFKGQDGFGYEYIFKTTSTNVAPSVPVAPTGGSWSTTPNVIPGDGISDETDQNYGWVDEPMEPKVESKYVWMCWRKYDHSTQKWTDFQGNSSVPGKARLWQVYANSINEVKEYFHADTSMSPDDINTPVDVSEYWKTDKSDWGVNRKYLFNVEVITFLDGKTQTLDPHLIAVWETGLVDVIDYYILESANGSQGNNDPGENAPHIKDGTPETSSIIEGAVAGKDYWTTSVPKMDKDYPVLWNISKKEYDGGKKAQWTTPIVIGVYGEGKNGEDSIYIDLTNEMDSVQIDKDNKVITERICSTTVTLYKGAELLEIADLDIAGEEAIDDNNDLSSITVKRTYHKGDTSSDSQINSDRIDITFTIPVGCVLRPSHKIVFTVTSTEGIVRKTGYTLVGTTHPAVYSIISASAVLVGENGNDPNPLKITVVKQTGSQLTSISGYSSNQGFELNYQKNSGDKVAISNNPFSVSTSDLSAGDKLTLTVDVDTDEDGTYETTLDRETIYALIQGKNGDKGEAGNGYRYYYARYVNNMSNDYEGATIPSLEDNASTVSIPVFRLGSKTLPASPNAQGADDSHTYEYRTEQFFNGSQWSNWSEPITIAKYLTADNIEEQVDAAVSKTTQGIKNDLATATSRLNTYFDASGNLKTGLNSDVTSALLSGYIDYNNLTSAINSIGLGGIVVTSGSTTTFNDYYSAQENRITTVNQSLNALSGELNTRITELNTSTNNIATAIDDFKVDAYDKFAQMDRTVANAQFMTDIEGYLMVNIPEYVVWFNSPSLLDDDYKDTNENRDVVWSIFKGMDTSQNIDVETHDIAETTPNPVYIPVDKLYRKDSDDNEFVTFLVAEDVSVNTYTTGSNNEEIFSTDNVNLPKYFNEFNVNNLNILYDKNSGKYIIKDNTKLYTPFDSQYDTVIGEGCARIVATCTVNITTNPGTKYTGEPISGFDTSNAYTYKLNAWTKGVLCDNMSFTNPTTGFNVDIKCACAKTGSIDEAPLLKSNDVTGYSDVFTGTVKQGEYGYGLSYNDNNSIVEADTNGKLSIKSSPQMYLIPGDTSVTDVMKYLNGSETPSITLVDDIQVHSGTNSYYVLTHYESAPSEPFSYTVDLPTSVISNKNVVNFSSDLFVNKFIRSIDNAKTEGFTDVDEGATDTSYRSINISNPDATIFDYYWSTKLTSNYDDIKFIFDCSNCKFTCANNIDNEQNFELISVNINYKSETIEETSVPLYSNASRNTTGEIPLFDTLTGIKTFNLSDLVDSLPIGEDLNFRLWVSLGSVVSISNIQLSYRIETKNKIIDSKSDISVTGFNLVPGTDYVGNTLEISAGNGGVTGGYPVCHIPITEYNVNKLSTNFWGSIDNSQYPKYTLGVFLISSNKKSSKVKLIFDTLYNIKYLCIPAKYDKYNIKQIVNDCVGYFEQQLKENGNDPDNAGIQHFFEIAKTNTFLNNNKYGTLGIYSWEDMFIKNICTVDFNDAIYSEADGRYYKTVLQYINSRYIPIDPISPDNKPVTDIKIFDVSELSWTTSKDGLTRTASSVLDKYMIDKIDVIVNDRLRTSDYSSTKRKAKDKNENDTKNYLDVINVERPYLIATVSELATISQMVSDGIACTQLITKAGEKQAVFFEQASKDGSIIYMNADEVGIKSNYFTLNNDGLSMKGDLYARDYNGNITAGVIGNNTKSTDVKFFAGISVPEDSDDLGTFIDNAPFRVYEDGRLVATNAQISGNITSNSVYSENTSTKIVDNVETQVTQKAIMDSSKFEISTEIGNKDDNTSQIAKIYITVLDKVTIEASDPAFSTFGPELSNVPTLCFEYMGNKYYLTPDSWKMREENVYNNTDIYFYNDGNNNNIYTSLLLSFRNTKYYTKSGNNYFYNPKSSNYVSGTPGKKYTFGYDVGDLDASDIELIVNKLNNNKLIDSVCFDTKNKIFTSNYIKLNMGNAKIPITNTSISECAAAKNSCTGSVFEPFKEQVHYVTFGGYTGAYQNDGWYEWNKQANIIPIDNLNGSVKNLLDTILYGNTIEGHKSSLRVTSDFIDNYGNPTSGNFEQKISMHLFDNGGENMCGYYTFTVNGAYETHYTNGNIDNTLVSTGKGFITGVYDFVIFMCGNENHRFDLTVTSSSGGNDIYTYDITRLDIKVTIGVYAESGLNGTSSDKDTLINLLKTSPIDSKNIHVYILAECKNPDKVYSEPILEYGYEDYVL